MSHTSPDHLNEKRKTKKILMTMTNTRRKLRNFKTVMKVLIILKLQIPWVMILLSRQPHRAFEALHSIFFSPSSNISSLCGRTLPVVEFNFNHACCDGTRMLWLGNIPENLARIDEESRTLEPVPTTSVSLMFCSMNSTKRTRIRQLSGALTIQVEGRSSSG